MSNIILNGDVYIKMLPDLVTKYKIKEKGFSGTIDIRGRSFDIKDLTSSNIEHLPPIIREFLEFYGIVKKEIGYIYNNNGFYQIWCNADSIFMINRNEQTSLEYSNTEEINLKYLNLWDYLTTAKFVGIYLVNPGHPMYEYLYTLNDINILRNPATGEYIIAATGSPMLEGYFSNNIKTNTYDINTVYQSIISQVIKHSEGNKRR